MRDSRRTAAMNSNTGGTFAWIPLLFGVQIFEIEIPPPPPPV